METKVQENQVRQMEFPFRKAPLPGFHYSCPGPLASQPLWLCLAAGEPPGKAPRFACPTGAWTPGGGLRHSPHCLRPQSPYLYGVRTVSHFFSHMGGRSSPLGSIRQSLLVIVGTGSCEVIMSSSLPISQMGRLRWREGSNTAQRYKAQDSALVPPLTASCKSLKKKKAA